MNKIGKFVLKALRKLYGKVFNGKSQSYGWGITDPNKAAEMIYSLLASGKPCMVARYGAFELASVVNYLGIKEKDCSWLRFVSGKSQQWWWNEKLIRYMETNAGFFPSNPDTLAHFGEMMIRDCREVDVLGSWQDEEHYLLPYMSKSLLRVHLRLLEPFWSEKPWSRVLRDKKVLVVHPFAESIISQYKNNRINIFDNKEILPEFKSLSVIKAVQSIGGTSGRFDNWFEALNYMKKKIEETDFDVALIGCGAYGFPLAAHVKRMGKQAVHLGGALQLLFGIRGNRWENPNYGVEQWGIPYGSYSKMMNDLWVKPLEKDKPASANKVEGACYW